MEKVHPEVSRERPRGTTALTTAGVAVALLYPDLVAVVAAGAGGALITLTVRSRPWLLDLPVRSMFLLHGALLLACAWLVTQGSGRWLELEILSEAYDSLARHLLSGSAEVDASAIRFEAKRVDGRTFMYFGPFPALLRLLPVVVAPSLYGRLARVSLMLSVVLSIWGLSLLLRAALSGSTRLPAQIRVRLYVAGLVGVVAASPFTVVLSCAAIYNEAICWGFCAAVWALYFAWRIVHGLHDPVHAILGLSLAAGAALLSRATFGIPAYAILTLLVLRYLLRSREGHDAGRTLVRTCLALLPALAAGLLQLWYNDARFGSIWEARQGGFYAGARPVGLEEAFHWSRIPSGLYAYFAIHAENFSSAAPWIRHAWIRPLQPAFFHDRTTPIISLVLTSPWTLAALWSGLGRVRDSARRRLLAVWLASLLAQVSLVLSFYWQAYRHTVDFLPFFVLLLAISFQEPDRRRARIFVGTVAASVVLTSLSSLHFHAEWWTYRPQHRAMASLLIERLNALAAPFW